MAYYDWHINTFKWACVTQFEFYWMLLVDKTPTNCVSTDFIKRKRRKRKSHVCKFTFSCRIEINVYHVCCTISMNLYCALSPQVSVCVFVFFYFYFYAPDPFNCILRNERHLAFEFVQCTSWCDSICIYLHIWKD